MAEDSMRSSTEFKTSRSGRRLFPRLKGWTGERIIIKKGGSVDILDGVPDCTSTFESERSLFRAMNGITMSQTLNFPATISQAHKMKISRSLSQSPSTETTLQRAIKRSKLKENQPVNSRTINKPSSSKKEIRRSSPSKLPKKSVSSSQESLVHSPAMLLRSRSNVTADPSQQQCQYLYSDSVNIPTKLPKKLSSLRKPPRERAVKSVSPLKTDNNRPSRSLVRNSANDVHNKPGPKCSKALPLTESSSRERLNRSGKKKKASNNKESPTRKSPRKNVSPTKGVDIYGPDFQPVVVLTRLRLKTEAAMISAMKNTSPKAQSRNRKRKSPVPKKKVSKSSPAYNGSAVRRPRTVKETQTILQSLRHPKSTNIVEDEAEANAAFFKKDHDVLKRLAEATDILHDNYDESDDNLSIRTMRESSPISSAVSPIGSLHGDSDADENSVNADGRLLGGSSAMKEQRTIFQRAQLVHRVVKDRAKLMLQQTKKLKKKANEKMSDEVAYPCGSSSSVTPRVAKLLQPQRMRALEKDLKARVGTRGFDFDTYYNGNLIHVSVNSDSESEESSVDSLAD